MNPLLELGKAVKARRSDMGLTLTAVARLSGLSRATVSALENGSIKDLSLVRSQKLLEVLGLSLSIPVVHKKVSLDLLSRRPALEIAAQTSNTGLKTRVTAAALQPALLTGEAPEDLLPHIRTLLDASPVSLLAGVVEQLHTEMQVDRPSVWRIMRTFAQHLQVSRDIFELDAATPARRPKSPAGKKHDAAQEGGDR
jgi:transcriptional regulator with XRE-family HTH domain